MVEKARDRYHPKCGCRLDAAGDPEHNYYCQGRTAGSDIWREALERALGIENDPVNHTPEWAERLVREIREIGNGVR